MKYINSFNESKNSLEDGAKIVLSTNFPLGDEYENAKSFISDEEYVCRKHKTSGYENWWVISGTYLNKDKSKCRYALSFSPKEFKDITKVIKK